MKSFMYTLVALFGIMTVAQAAGEQKAEEATIEEVSAEAEAPAEDEINSKKAN